MTPSEGTALLAGSALAAAAGTSLLGGGLRREQRFGFLCPHLGKSVDCRVAQDVRTGQWKAVRACSAFDDPEQVLCDLECARLANLGLKDYRLSRT